MQLIVVKYQGRNRLAFTSDKPSVNGNPHVEIIESTPIGPLLEKDLVALVGPPIESGLQYGPYTSTKGTVPDESSGH